MHSPGKKPGCTAERLASFFTVRPLSPSPFGVSPRPVSQCERQCPIRDNASLLGDLARPRETRRKKREGPKTRLVSSLLRSSGNISTVTAGPFSSSFPGGITTLSPLRTRGCLRNAATDNREHAHSSTLLQRNPTRDRRSTSRLW